MIKVIGLTGPIGSGKTTAAIEIERIAYKLGFCATSISFADALKAEAFQLGWNGVKDAEGRRLLQDLGQTRRDDDIDYWVSEWQHRAMVYMSKRPSGIIIADDVRYDNEAITLKSLGGRIIRITERCIGELGDPEHPSEQGVSVDHIATSVPNTANLENFLFQIRFVLHRSFDWPIIPKEY